MVGQISRLFFSAAEIHRQERRKERGCIGYFSDGLREKDLSLSAASLRGCELKAHLSTKDRRNERTNDGRKLKGVLVRGREGRGDYGACEGRRKREGGRSCRNLCQVTQAKPHFHKNEFPAGVRTIDVLAGCAYPCACVHVNARWRQAAWRFLPGDIQLARDYNES